jgi:disulfide bond formation protein DsbB
MRTSFAMVLAAVLAAALLLAACGSPAPTAAPTPAGPAGDPAKGQQLFTATCSACHGPDAKGLPNLGKDLTASEFAIGLSDAELVEFIKTGRPIGDPLNTTGVDMPPKGGNPALTDQDLADIVAFLRTLE